MSRDVKLKRQLVWYQANDTDAIARQLEKMAVRGWLLEGADNLFLLYRRSEPVRTRYAVTFFPEASVYDPGLTEGQETYADYCRAAGWELAAAYGPLQIFRAVRPDPAPIETDEAVKLSAVRRAMRKTFVPGYALLLVLPALYAPMYWNDYRREPMEFFSRGYRLGLLAIAAAILLLGGGMLLDHLGWVLRSKWSVARGGACAKPHTRFRLWLSGGALAVSGAGLLLAAFDSPLSGGGGLLAVSGAVYGGFLLAARWVLRKLKSRGRSRNAARALYFCFAAAAGLAIGIGTPFLFARLANAGLLRLGREPAETYTYVSSDGSFRATRDVYRDPLPITLEDLGYPVAPEDHCSYRATVHRTFLAVHAEYLQRPLNFDSKLPELRYQVYETSWPWLLETCWDGLTGEDPDDPWPVRELVPAPWGAERACRRGDLEAYVLLYPDRIVTLNLWTGAAERELEAVARAAWGAGPGTKNGKLSANS